MEISFFGAEPVLGEVRKILKSWGYPEPEYGKSDGMDYWRQQIPEQGETCVIWAKEALPAENEGETALRLLWSTASASGQASCIEKAAGNLHEVLEADFEAIYGEHRDWWKEYCCLLYTSLGTVEETDGKAAIAQSPADVHAAARFYVQTGGIFSKKSLVGSEDSP